MKKRRLFVELHYDDRCNYMLFIDGEERVFYLEVTEEELTSMGRVLEIEAIDDNDIPLSCR